MTALAEPMGAALRAECADEEALTAAITAALLTGIGEG